MGKTHARSQSTATHTTRHTPAANRPPPTQQDTRPRPIDRHPYNKTQPLSDTAVPPESLQTNQGLYPSAEEAPTRVVENYTCPKEGNFTVTVNASDALTSEEATVEVCCVNHVSRNWKLESDSPKIAPPGEITVTLSYIGDATYFPLDAVTDMDFGDSDSKTDILIDSESFSVTETHAYAQGGVYNVTAHVRNSVDLESFSTEVLLLDKLGDLTVTAQYAENENSENKDLHGPDQTDVPVNAVVSFFCNVSGSAENYTMETEGKTVTQDGSNPIFTNQFEEVGEYVLTFVASNFLEEINSVTLTVRVMTETVGLGLTADPTSILPGDEVVFSIDFVFADPFTCISFDADEGETLETFGNEETCRVILEDGMHFNQRDEQRKRRETEEASWVDDNNIR
ncbi:hypothetical protein AVEN_36117-1 [Araneus ventricosus]|uniref:PKD domain-containing protein n=1 Tax=Araneus ventricosus TaxID=182803 RepID=A0A4Y2TT67_ARAVE|nr:hypothetical protein AVEN_36117-1 [Araneus ventricosus]